MLGAGGKSAMDFNAIAEAVVAKLPAAAEPTHSYVGATLGLEQVAPLCAPVIVMSSSLCAIFFEGD